MKLRIILLITGVSLFALASIVRLANSDVFSGSLSYTIQVLSLALVGSVIIGYFVIKAVRKKLKIVAELRTEYDAAYLCMVKIDPINTYVIVSTATDIIIVSNDKKKTPLVELKKNLLDFSISEISVRGVRKQPGLIIALKPGIDDQTKPVEVLLLDDSKLITPPLDDSALQAALVSLNR